MAGLGDGEKVSSITEHVRRCQLTNPSEISATGTLCDRFEPCGESGTFLGSGCNAPRGGQAEDLTMEARNLAMSSGQNHGLEDCFWNAASDSSGLLCDALRGGLFGAFQNITQSQPVWGIAHGIRSAWQSGHSTKLKHGRPAEA